MKYRTWPFVVLLFVGSVVGTTAAAIWRPWEYLAPTTEQVQHAVSDGTPSVETIVPKPTDAPQVPADKSGTADQGIAAWGDVRTACDHGNRVYHVWVQGGPISVVAGDPTCPKG